MIDLKSLSFVTLAMLSLTGCREVTPLSPVVSTPTRSVILVNTSFELGGAPTYSGWSVSDPTRAGFSSDTPPEGGNWSAAIITTSGTPVYTQTTVPTTPGDQVYKLTVWSKKTVVNGTAALIVKREAGSESSSSITIDMLGWQPYTLFDTLSTLPGDSVIVRLSGGRANQPTGSILFDLCLLEQI